MRRAVCFFLSLFLMLGLTACSQLEDLDFNKIMDQIFASDDRPARPIIQTSPSDSGDGGKDSAPKAEEPVIPDHSGASEPAEPDPVPAEDPAPAPSESPDPAPADPGGGTVTASHSDATFFGPGEFFHFQPKGISGILKNRTDNLTGIRTVRVHQHTVHTLLGVNATVRHGPPDAPLAVGGGVRVAGPAGVAAPGAKVFCNHRGSFAASNAGQFNLDSKVLFFMLSYAIFKASLIFSRRSGIIAVPEPRGFGLLEQSELFQGVGLLLFFYLLI